MLTTRRVGLTLIEMLISLSLAGVVLAMFASLSLRQQRVYADMSDRASLSGQLRDAAAIVPVDLRALSAAAGDIREARDTSIELRATIGSAVVCDTAAGSVVLAPASAGASSFASFGVPADVGDTAWILAPGDSVDAWTPSRITGVGSDRGGKCASGGPLVDSAASSGRIRLTLERTPSAIVGTPLRITRPVRYSLYKASDNQWYFGERDWNAASARFNTIQPVAGPFLSASGGGFTLTYFDSSGGQLPAPVANPRAIALVRAQLVGQTRAVTRAMGAAGPMTRRGDTAIVLVALRNRR